MFSSRPAVHYRICFVDACVRVRLQRGANFMETYTKIRNDPVNFAPNGSNVSTELVDLLTGLLEKDPRHRLTLEEALRHPWASSSSRRRSGR
eukprot:COSAG02_NODE_208_length_29027_cov_27.870230_14_plen_92_part_00